MHFSTNLEGICWLISFGDYKTSAAGPFQDQCYPLLQVPLTDGYLTQKYGDYDLSDFGDTSIEWPPNSLWFSWWGFSNGVTPDPNDTHDGSADGYWCQRMAIENGLVDASATFKTWLSTDTSNPGNRFLKATGNYVLPSGTVIAHGWNDLIDGSLAHPIDELVTGATSPSLLVLTGTNPDGTSASANCNNWTSEASTITTCSGLETDGDWSERGNNTACDPMGAAWQLSGVYCVQQTGPAPNVPDPGPTPSPTPVPTPTPAPPVDCEVDGDCDGGDLCVAGDCVAPCGLDLGTETCGGPCADPAQTCRMVDPELLSCACVSSPDP